MGIGGPKAAVISPFTHVPASSLHVRMLALVKLRSRAEDGSIFQELWQSLSGSGDGLVKDVLGTICVPTCSLASCQRSRSPFPFVVLTPMAYFYALPHHLTIVAHRTGEDARCHEECYAFKSADKMSNTCPTVFLEKISCTHFILQPHTYRVSATEKLVQTL